MLGYVEIIWMSTWRYIETFIELHMALLLLCQSNKAACGVEKTVLKIKTDVDSVAESVSECSDSDYNQ
jgi:hypothetical protein